ncbi:DUF3142 domain-containing protein [Novosphingobium sp. BW1]|uniref:DUF3142 domain-containing protein n=1 Tax=Novosphingobium sp. BW1 TaxID=2592621 RepID=UPI0011DE627D|nr:DUF3142 domain-containing protein [Novosphingobium sp. BW1]TYC87470.1 DUF3142 domain-containing protein [Novosphingobium sp. BW1]
MDDQAQVLLVSRRALLGAGVAALALLLAACGGRGVRAPGRVRARDHEAFFLWAGVAPPSWLGEASLVYLLGGEVRVAQASVYVPLRAVPRTLKPRVWMSLRVERLDWEEGLYTAVLGQLVRWAAAGNAVEGLQIDFDAATHGLAGYAQFLVGLRARLPARFKLGITGMMDWSAGGSADALASLADCVDEIVVQTYQGRATIPGYERYLASLERLGLPYRVGLVEGGEWRAPPGLEAGAGFRGYVVFLVGSGDAGEGAPQA